MKITLDRPASEFSVQSYAPGAIRIGGRVYTTRLLVTQTLLLPAWGPETPGALTEEHLEDLIERRPDILLLGTGPLQQMQPLSLLVPLMETGIGCETMATGAACRTYNLLLSERRRVAAVLFP